jgi:membrane protein involved in colicin uptake
MADKTEGTAATVDPPQDPPVTSEPLGDGGKAALDAERKARKAAEKAARDAQAKLDKLTEASQSDTEKAIEKARREAAEAAKAEVTTAFRQRILKSEIRAQAAGKFADPDDAVSLLDLDDSDVFDADGEVRTDALAKELDALLDRKPHLKADPSNGRPAGDADAGKGAGASGKTPEQQHNELLAGLLQRAPL